MHVVWRNETETSARLPCSDPAFILMDTKEGAKANAWVFGENQKCDKSTHDFRQLISHGTANLVVLLVVVGTGSSYGYYYD